MIPKDFNIKVQIKNNILKKLNYKIMKRNIFALALIAFS
jgi:hypothetical protein